MKIRIGSAEFDLESCPKDFQEKFKKNFGISPSQTVAKVDFPEEFMSFAKKEFEANEEYVRHRAKFGPPMLKEWAQMILAAAGEKCEG